MEPPKSAEIFKTSNSEYWFDEGVLFVIMKNAPPPPLEGQKRQIEEFKQKLNGKKICCIMDFTNASYSPSSSESRQYNSIEMPKIFNSIAMVSSNSFTRMLAHLFLGFSTPTVPFKVFSNEEEAREWIKQYL